MNKYKISTILLTVLSAVLIALTIYYSANKQIEYITVENTDTIFVHTVDTVKVNKSEIIYRDVHILDTIYIKDTALVVEQKVYEDTISTIYFKGINAEIDSIEYRLPKDTVHIFTETTNTISQKESFWHNRFVVTAGVYAGYGLLNRKPDIYVGLGFGVRLY